MNTKIIGAGSSIPNLIIKNEDFLQQEFFDEKGRLIPNPESIVSKFKEITGIEERRYAEQAYVTSDLAFDAAQKAIADAQIDQESLDYIILAHNYGDVPYGSIQSDTVPSLAARVKAKLGIVNPKCVAYDVLFGCPGWIEGLIQAYAFIRASMAKRCLVIGADVLSRVTDQHDRDTMIFADGAGAVVVEAQADQPGILATASATYAVQELEYLNFGPSYKQDLTRDVCYIKMKGRKIYEFALSRVPEAMKACLDQGNIPIEQVKKVLIHQANEKMDYAILERFYKLYDMAPPEDVMPMTIHKLGNSSVATIPTLYDLMKRDLLPGQQLKAGDIVLFASVGAGMNINAVAYQV